MSLRKQLFLLSGFIIASLIMIIWGATSTVNTLSQLLIACGGASLGASFSSILGVINDQKMYNHIITNMESKFSSNETDIRDYRKLYHIYWVSMLEGKPIWMYSTMDYSKNKIPGKLNADFYPMTPHGKRVLYKSEGIIRGKRFINVDVALVGNEPPAVLIYPNFGNDYSMVNYGFGYYETFEEKEVLAPVILSEKIIANWSKEGYINDASQQILWDSWEQNMSVIKKPEKFIARP